MVTWTKRESAEKSKVLVFCQGVQIASCYEAQDALDLLVHGRGDYLRYKGSGFLWRGSGVEGWEPKADPEKTLALVEERIVKHRASIEQHAIHRAIRRVKT